MQAEKSKRYRWHHDFRHFIEELINPIYLIDKYLFVDKIFSTGNGNFGHLWMADVGNIFYKRPIKYPYKNAKYLLVISLRANSVATIKL